MTTRSLTEPTLRALVAELSARGGDPPPVVAVEAAPRWTGSDVVDTDVGPVRVVPCVSPLAVREALIDHRQRDGETLLLLTDQDEAALGEEVLARIWRGRLVRPSSFEALRQLARVQALDPKLASERWLTELLVEVAPSRGFSVSAPMLTLDAAWRLLYRHALHLDLDRPELADLLRWAQTDTAHEAVVRLSETARIAVAEHLSRTVGGAAGELIRLVHAGKGTNTVAFGLVADVIYRDLTDTGLGYARARFERIVGTDKLEASAASAWGRAAVAVARDAARGTDEEVADLAAWCGLAEQVLDQAEASSEIAASDVLPTAFERRREQAGFALSAALDDPTSAKLKPLEMWLAAVRGHLSAPRSERRVLALEAAVRLVRRAVAPPQPAGEDLAAQARDYLADGAWVDAARLAISGETVGSLAQAYDRLLASVDGDRATRDRRFAAALAASSTLAPDPDGPVLPIEAVLDQVVAPLAGSAPVLVLVIDGLSHATASPLLRDLTALGWRRSVPADGELPPVLAVLPTVTNVSRSSLLTGQLTVGGQDVERDGFAGHAGLLAVSGGKPPRLFHKADLRDQAGQVAPAVLAALRDAEQQVVGVVVNAVDDHLAKGGQLQLAEGLAGIRPLEDLLSAAAEAPRAVVLTSDHGHIIEVGTTYRATAGGGERWRSSDEPVREDEVLLEGPRVLRGEGRIVAPATDQVRYVTDIKHGYHGGAIPAEALCPLAVLLPTGLQLDGWAPAIPARPLWWEAGLGVVPEPAGSVDEAVAEAAGRAASRPGRRRKSTLTEGMPTLFDSSAPDAPATSTSPVEEGAGAAPSGPSSVQEERPAWVRSLLASPELEQQRTASGRAALDDDQVAELVTLLAASGGALPMNAVAQRTGTPPVRIRGKLEALKRLLNLDGYEVVELHSDGTVRLNLTLLATQFGVDV